jgi:hypothetical protein
MALKKGDACSDAARASLHAAEVLAAGLRAELDGQTRQVGCVWTTPFLIFTIDPAQLKDPLTASRLAPGAVAASLSSHSDVAAV